MSSLYVDTIRNKDGNGAPTFDRGVVISGIITATGSLGGDSVGIGSTTVIDSSFQLKNIASLDSVTLSTFESALQIAPNNFTSLNISGISTFTGNVFAQSDVTVTGSVGASRVAGVALSVSGFFYSSGVSTALYLQGTHLNYSGISTISHPRGVNLDYSGISTLTNARGTSLYFSGISTADHLRSTTFNSTGVSTVTYLQGTNLNYSGISTIVSLSSSSITGTSLTATNANIPNLSASSITGTSLTATSASIATLTVNTAITTTSNVQTLNAVSIAATTLDGDSIVGLAATITNLTATSFGTQSATVAIGTVTTLSSTNLNTRDVSSVGVITSTQFHTGAAATSIRILPDRITGPSEILIDPASIGVTGSVRIAGDLYVDGSQFIVNSTTIELADFNVGIASTVATNALLDGAGIGIGSTGIRKTITWNNSASALTSSEDWNLALGKQYEIDGTAVLNSTTLGSGILNSSLTSVGTLGSLSVNTNISANGNISGAGINAGFSTLTTLSGTLLNYPSVFVRTGIITNSSGERLNYTGLSTVTNARGTTLEYTGISTVTHIRGTTLNYTGISTLSNIVGTSLSCSGISTIANIYAGFTTSVILNTISFGVAGVSTFSNTINAQAITANGIVNVVGSSYQIGGNNVLTSNSIGSGVTNSSLQNVGTLAGINVSGISTLSGRVQFGGLILEELGGEIQNNGSFPTGVTYTAITDTLTVDLSLVGSVIAGDPSGQIDIIEFTNAPVFNGYMTELTLITEGDVGGWDTGNISITVNGSAPTNVFWKDGSQPVGTTTSNPAFDIVRFKILRDSLGNYSVFADWDAYY